MCNALSIRHPNEPGYLEKIIGCCFKVHKELGPGFNEKIYQNALIGLFEEKNIKYETEKEYEVKYLNKKVGIFRVDMVVEAKIIVEIKALIGNLHMQLTPPNNLNYRRQTIINTLF
ncbi:MAG: GxxExxY protein [bacterium]